MSKSATNNATILWAVDPFLENKDILKSAAWCLRALTLSSPAVVEPVYVQLKSPLEIEGSDKRGFLQGLQKKGEEEMGAVLVRIKIPGIHNLRILNSSALTVREEALELVAYAKKLRAELIVVSSHGRKGVKRWLLGSFTETLTLFSDVPLLTVHPNWKRIPEFKTILFPTDFSEESKEAFATILNFAEKRKSRIILFHKAIQDFYPAFDTAFSVSPAYEQSYLEGLAENRKSAAIMSEEASRRGLRVDIVFDRSKSTSVSDAILKRAKRFGSMIALVSHSGPISSVLLGSTTRQVVRYSEQPVWVVHPNQRKTTNTAQVKPLYSTKKKDIESNLKTLAPQKTA